METDSTRLSTPFNNWEFLFFQSPRDLTSLLIIVFFFLIVLILLQSTARVYASGIISLAANGKSKEHLSLRAIKNIENTDLISKAVASAVFVTIVISVFLLSGFTNLIFGFLPNVFLKTGLQLVTILLALFISGDILPQVIASKIPITIIRLTAYPVFWLERTLHPFIILFLKFEKFLKSGYSDNRKSISIDEITQVLHMNNETESADQKEILEEIVKFGNKNVSDIMRPRVDVVSIDIKTDFKDVLNVIIDSGFSRIPVYSGSFDNIRGIVYVKDILPHSHKNEFFNWQSVIRPPFFVPETKKINALLQEFQKNKVHLAMVIDEYGGTSGIVTLEDILEEIVGEIVDEFDDEDLSITKTDDNTFVFDGKTLIVDFLKTTKCDDSIFSEVEGEYETVAGLILKLRGDIPQLHDKIQFKHLTFTIEAADKRRILRIKAEIGK